MNPGRWVWEIDRNGTYEFHSEAPEGLHLTPARSLHMRGIGRCTRRMGIPMAELTGGRRRAGVGGVRSSCEAG
jgi:hypothetical protein